MAFAVNGGRGWKTEVGEGQIDQGHIKHSIFSANGRRKKLFLGCLRPICAQ